MKVFLCIPRPSMDVPGVCFQKNAVFYFPLRWTTAHPQSNKTGVLLDAKDNIFDGHAFRSIRLAAGAWIETDKPDRVAGALGVPLDESGIENINGSGKNVGRT
jgi:hypothetical protein